MREILFRGKSTQPYNGNIWVYGFPFITRTGKANIRWYCERYGSSKTSYVIPETLSQYIGMKDKNGTKIFEGDIVRIWEHDNWWQDRNKWQEYDNKNYLVRYDENGTPELVYKSSFGVYNVTICEALKSRNDMIYNLEVIGNKWDNTELLPPEIVKKLQND